MAEYASRQLKKIESAIIFLVAEVSKYSKNPKPLVLHSVRVGTKLIDMDSPAEVAIAGFLHDLVEDTKCTASTIRKKFGKKVAAYVQAMTMDYKYTDYHERWFEAMQRLKKLGKYALLIKLVDSDDNIPYYSKIMSRKDLVALLWKAELVQKMVKKDWCKTDVFGRFSRAIQKIKREKAIKPA
jgi:(p)ppGpp synthase/HD superfamily hydrolase